MITNSRILYQLLPDLKSGFFSPDSNPSDFLFFDIETTGLSPRTSRVFLIGLMQKQSDASSWEQIQLLSEHSDSEEETAVLLAFSSYVKTKKYLVHFNGTSFDVPYLIHRYETLGLPHPFSEIIQIDLYRELLRMPSFFRQMENHRQKSFEKLVSYSRNDTLSGKEMIKIYQNYEKSEDSKLLQLLFLHNDNDLEGMIKILPLGNLKQLLLGAYEISDVREISETTMEGISERKLLFTLSLEHPVCAQLSSSVSFCYITVLNRTVKIKMPLYEGTLKYFYTDYKNYYYLPYEDEAVHKSIAVYMESSRREKAKAANCYKKCSGSFLYAPGNPPLPLLREDYTSKAHYVLWPFNERDSELLSSYLHEILKTAVTEK